MLARRELSAAQVTERLRRRGFGAREVETTVARLQAEGVIDDLRTARTHARRLAATAHRGPFRAEREIAALGIAAPVAHAAVAEAYTEHGVQTVLEQALRRRLPTGAAVEGRIHFGKLYRYLVRRGFEPEMVTATLRDRAGASAGPDDEDPS